MFEGIDCAGTASPRGPACAECDRDLPRRARRGLCFRCWDNPVVRYRHPDLRSLRKRTAAPGAARRLDPPPCRHCKRPAKRAKGLCWKCSQTPAIRDRYPSLSKYARAAGTPTSGGARQAALPTDAVPGTSERLAVYAQRARQGLSLHHPADARGDLS